MIQINPLKSYIDGGVRAALTTPPSASLVFDLPGKAIWVKGVKLKGTDHTYTFSHDNYITLTNTPDSNESEDIKIGVNTSALKSAIDTTYGVVSTTANGLAPKFTSGNKLAASAATTYYFLGWAGTTLKWYQAPFRNIRINSETTDRLGVNNTDPLIISSGNGISVTWDSTNKKIVITNTKPDVNHNTDRTGIKLATVSGTKKTDSTLILANSTTGLNIQGGINKFLIGNGTNYIEVPVTPSFTVSNKDATIGTALTTIATIAGVDIKAKIALYSLYNHTHSVKINGSTKTITASETVNLGNYLPLSGGYMTGTAWIVWPDSGNYGNNNSGVTFPVIRGGLHWLGLSDWIKLFSEETSRDNLNLVLQFGDDNSNGLSIRNTSNVQTSHISAGGVITTGTFKGNLDWSYITNKPSSYIPSAHTHAWNSLTHSSTTENQAILTNGTANGWKLYTLNISGWNNAANNAHSHSNKSVLDGITSTLVNNWNTAYNFVNTISGTDTDKVINKWDEIVNFLAGISEDDKLNTLLNNKLSILLLSAKDILTTKTNNALFWVNTKGTASSITTGPFTDHPYALLSVTNYNLNTENSKFFYRSRLAFSSTGDIKVASCHHENVYKLDETWYNILTSKNSGISGSTIKLNGTSITVYSSSAADSRFVKKAGDTMSGALTIDTTGFGALIIKRNDDANGASIQFRGKSNVYGYIGLNNSTKDKLFLRWNSDTSKTYIILDTSSTYVSSGKGIINGTTITQVDNATNATNSTNSTNARKLINWYPTRPTSLNTQFGDGSLRIFYATSSTTEGKSPSDATVLHLAWDNNGGWDTQLGINPPSGRVYSRAQNSGTWQSWKTLAFTSDIPTALKNPHALTISLNGASQGPYDGSAAKNINITPSSIGAATSGHNHDGRYLALSGGTMTGTIRFNNLIDIGPAIVIDYKYSASGFARNIISMKNSVYEDANLGALSILCYPNSTSNGFLYIYLGTDKYDGPNNLRIYKDKVTFGNNILIDAGNISSLTVANAYHLRINSANTWSTWNWAGLSDQPSWLWGSNDGTNMYVWNPSNFRVAYASSATNADKVDGYHANTVYNAPSFIVNNGYTSNTYILLATITIGGTSLAMAEFTILFQNRECLDSSSFILSGAIRRNSTTSVGASLSYITLHTEAPRNIYMRSDDGVTFRIYIQSLANNWTTYYRAIPIVDSENITYSNTGTTSPISGSVLNITATKGGNVNYANSAGSALTATIANKLGTSTVGATNVPIYLNGGTPTVVNLNSTANNLINNLSVGDSVPADNDYYISQYVNGGTTNTTYYRRSHLLLYKYIKSKAEGTWNISINGNAKGLLNNGVLDSQEKIDNFLTANRLEYATFKTTESNNVGFNANDGMILSIPWSDVKYGAQIAFDDTTSGTVKVRGKNNSWGNWYTLLHSGNSSVSGGGNTWGSSITVNINGTSKTLTIPGNPNTDYRVTQSETTTSNYRPLVLGYTSVSTAGSGMTGSVTNQVYLSNKFYVQPSTGNLYATNFVGTLSGNASSATKLQTARNLWGNSFNGTADINGTIRFNNVTSGLCEGILWTCGDNDFARIKAGATGSDAGYLEIATADGGSEPIYVRQYSGVFNSVVRTLTLLDANGYSHFPSYINIGGNENNNYSPDRVWGSNGSDSYLRSYRTSALRVAYANSAGLLTSKGTISPLTGRTQNLGDVYSYHLNASVSGGPTTYMSVIGFGRGTAGTVEIAGEWTGGRGIWVRALRDCCDDWYSWDKILTLATYTEITDSRYYTRTESDNRFVNVTGDTMSGILFALTIQGVNNSNRLIYRHLDGQNCDGNYDLYLQYHQTSSVIYLNGSTYKIYNSGANYNGNAATATNADKLDGYHASSFALSGHTHSYLPLAGGTMTGTINANDNTPNTGIKFKNNSANLNALSNLHLILGSAIRFGEYNTWDWNVWAGLKYDSSSKTIYLGLADGTIFNANSVLNGGSLRFPGISNVYATTFNGSLSGNAATSTKSEYSRSLLGRNTSGSDYDAISGNLVFAEWNTKNDNRWYLKAANYECRVSYANNSDTVDGYHASNLVKFYLSPMTNDAPADSAKSWFINTMPSGSGAIVYNVPGSEKTIIAGKSSGAYGHMLQLNYDNTYIRILRYYNGSWKSTDWEKISAGYADSAGNADTVDGLHANAFATANHTHSYLPLSGGTMTGVIKSTYTSGSWIGGVTNAIVKGEYTGYGAILSMPVKDGRVSLSSYPANDNNIYFGYATTAQINAGTNSFNKQMFWDAANNNLHAGVFTGYLSGNASTASKWLTARTLTIGNTGKTVDGSGNVSWTLAEIGAATSGHTHTLSLASDTGTSSITLAHGCKYKLTAGGNSIIFTLPTSNNINPTNYYWANVRIGASSNVGTAPQFNKVKINTTSSTYQLNVNGDSYTTGWSRAASGFYCHDTGVHFTHNGTKGQIAITSNNEFCWGASNNTLYFNYTAPSLGTTVTKYVWNAGSSSTYASHTTGDIILGNKSYLITRSGCTSDWYNGRNNAMIRITSASTCSALTSIKTRNGSWEMGNGLLINDYLYFSYVSDSAFNNADYDYVPPLVYFSSAGVHATHFYELSDIKYKKILRNLSINSNTIATLPLFDFEWIENNIIGTGTSALAVLLILPNLVSGTDRLTLDYGVLGTIAGITACKELVTLKSELLQLKEKVKELEDKLRKYENI